MLKDYIAKEIIQCLEYDPTESQSVAIEKIAEFLSDSNSDRVFVLNGYAGTGKTTLLGALVSYLKKNRTPVILMAPTGRAAKVLSSYTHASAKTIHKTIYRQVSLKDGLGKFSLNINKSKSAIFIVDEVSMLANGGGENAVFGSGRLLDDLFEYVKQGTDCHLILVGDNAQLPPVGMDQSPALNTEQIREYAPDVYASDLTDVVRQKESGGILHNATRLRNQIEQAKADFAALETKPSIVLKGFSDIQALSGSELIEAISSSYYKIGEEDTMIICRTNKLAKQYNMGIRSRIFGREDELVRGERLMVVKNSYAWVEKDPAVMEKIDFVANGDIVEIVHIYKSSYDMHGFRFADVRVKLPDFDDVEMDCSILLDTLHSDAPALGREESARLYESVAQDYMEIKNARKRNNAIKADPYYSAMQVKYAYAVTCHKAQGGQWKHVFLDHGWMGEGRENLEFLRWFYTGITRATEQLFLVNCRYLC